MVHTAQDDMGSKYKYRKKTVYALKKALVSIPNTMTVDRTLMYI